MDKNHLYCTSHL